METGRHPVRAFVVSLAIIAGLGYGGFWAFSKVLGQLSAVTSDLGKAIVAAGATAMVATISLVFGKIWEQRVKLQEEVRQRKLPVYETHIQFLFKVLLTPKGSNEGSPSPAGDEIAAQFRAFTAQIVVWGGPEVIKTWTAFRLHGWEGTNPLPGFLKFEAFVKAIRAELGNKNTTLESGDLMKLFINDLDTDKVPVPTDPAKMASGSTP